MMFDSKDALLKAIRVYCIRRNVEYSTDFKTNRPYLTSGKKRICCLTFAAVFVYMQQ